jgi:hypothetical protein
MSQEILNTSRYNTDDVMAIVRAFANGKDSSWSRIKIRHMIKPRTHKSWNGRAYEKQEEWAKLIDTGEYDIEIGLLHPNKLGHNVLDRIAFHDDEQANAKVCNDLARCIHKKVNYSRSSDVSTDLRIRLVEEDENAKLKNAYRNLSLKVNRDKVRLANDKNRLAAIRKEITSLEHRIPAQEKDLARNDKRLAKQGQVLRSKGLL